MRIGLFLLTNLAVVLVASIVLSLLGVNSYFAASGSGLDLGALLVFCAVFGMVGSLISLFISKWMAKRGTGTRIIAQPRNHQEQWLIMTVQRLSDKAGIKMPEVGIFPAQESNAFATGWNKNDALVAVSQGLLDRMDNEQIEAVLAHEIGHVANGDMVTLSLIQGVVNTFVMFFARIIGSTIDRLVFKNEEGHGLGFFITTIIAELVLGILASIIVMKFSRWREYRADYAGATLASRQGMIRALQGLQAEQKRAMESSMPDSLYAFGINGNLRNKLGDLFASHPRLEDRIRALQQGG